MLFSHQIHSATHSPSSSSASSSILIDTQRSILLLKKPTGLILHALDRNLLVIPHPLQTTSYNFRHRLKVVILIKIMPNISTVTAGMLFENFENCFLHRSTIRVWSWYMA